LKRKIIKIFVNFFIVLSWTFITYGDVFAIQINGPTQPGYPITLQDDQSFHSCETCLNLLGGYLQQGQTNWCLPTCMNIVYRDILAKTHRQPNQILGATPNTSSFAELAFVFNPADLDVNPATLPQASQDYIRDFFAPFEFRDALMQVFNFSRNLKLLTPGKRSDIWHGVPAQVRAPSLLNFLNVQHPQEALPAMPQEIREKMSTSVNSAVAIFNDISNNPNFATWTQVDFIMGTNPMFNPWREIFNDIWNNERVVIINRPLAKLDP
jgi:hypothetical protein